jgi:predicted 3-demethylubiquinone-9 3-methyltransferase (glyoxalase superfamily)
MQRISPFLWFDDKCEEAVRFYTGVFPDSRLLSLRHYPAGMSEEHMRNMEGKVLTATFELAGQQFLALDGGPYMKHSPAVSLFCASEDENETAELWGQLSAGGQELMPLGEYPFSKLYGWCNDRYGLSWQCYTGAHKQRISPMLMFTGGHFGQAEEAMRFYTGIFPGSSSDEPARYPAGTSAAGSVLHGEFELAGYRFMAMDSDLDHKFGITGAISFFCECDDQAEIDRLWAALPAGGGAEQQCGWLNDRWGVHWQLVPHNLMEMQESADEATLKRIMSAVLKMVKLDQAELERVYAERD